VSGSRPGTALESRPAAAATEHDIDAVPRRHPWRWVSAAVVAAVLLGYTVLVATAPGMEWSVVGEHLFSEPVLRGVRNTVVMTVLSMLIGVVLGSAVAIMRLSANPVMITVATLYQWFFRGTPTLVQLIFWFNLALLLPGFELTVLGVRLISLDVNQVMTPLLAALLGLGLNFAAYYSEIVRAGILAVDEGQVDASRAYGASRAQTLRHIVLPQAMRVIIPPTGNELIGMLKWTAMASVVSYAELLRSVQDIYTRTYEVMPLLTVAAIWYLAMTTLLTVGQYFLERRFSRGSTRGHAPSPFARLVAGLRPRGATT
jgi:polar amino acid transport system permease protein